MPTLHTVPFSSILCEAIETHTSANYRWNNRNRGSANCSVIQRTLAGVAYFDEGNNRIAVPVGSCMLFTHHEPTNYGYPENVESPYTLQFINFELGTLEATFQRIRADFGSVVLMSEKGEAAALLTEIARHYQARSFRDRFHEADLLHQLLINIYREQISAKQILDPIDFGHHLLLDRYRSPLNLKEVAQKCGISREYFNRGYRLRYGEPPGALLRRLRLNHAQRMLQTTQVPVQEVALASGFSDANTFCRAYRHRFGVTPGSLRPLPHKNQQPVPHGVNKNANPL